MMKNKRYSIDNDSFTRQVSSKGAALDDDGTITFPLSSEEPYARYYWKYEDELDEILSHDAGAVDLSYIDSGYAPTLDSHKSHGGLKNQIGVVRTAWIENKRLYVKVSFSNRAEAQAILKDVLDGIISNVSVGYKITEYVVDEKKKTLTATKWKPHEASFVPIPADVTVGVGRSAQKKGTTIMTTETKTKGLPGVPVEMTDDERGAAVAEAMSEISALGASHNMSDVARSFINGEISRGFIPSLAVFKSVVSAKLPENTPLVNDEIGLTPKERKQFSIMNIARSEEFNDPGRAEFEREVSDAARSVMVKSGITDHGGWVIPVDILENLSDFSVDGTDSRSVTGQAQIRNIISTGNNPNVLTTDLMSGSFFDNLRNMTSILRAGVSVMQGLSNDLDIPGADVNAEAFWLEAEDDDVAETTLTQRLVSLRPKDLGAFINITRRMMQQQTLSMEALARQDLIIAHSLAIDLAGIYGDGTLGKPLGIFNTPGIGSNVFAAASPNRDEIIDQKTVIATTNRGRGVTHMGNSQMVGDLQKTRNGLQDVPGDGYLMNDTADRLLGTSFIESNQIENGDLLTGYFPDAYLGMWGGLQLERSKEQKFLSAGITLRSIQTVDFAVRRVGSFAFGAAL